MPSIVEKHCESSLDKMTGGSRSVEFSFVSYQGPEVPQDAADEAVIRHHASRNVATTRRQRNNYGGHNQRQNHVVYMNDDKSPKGT